MTRVTTGTAKNRNLTSPDIPEFRAIQEVAKSAVFSIIGADIIDSQCLDLFAGSGNMGIEALSRGAAWCDFVDANRKAVQAIEKNLENCKLSGKAEIHQQEAAKFVANAEKVYDIIFMDPFYKDVKQKYLMELLPDILHPAGAIFFFHGENLVAPDILEKSALSVVNTRKYGKSVLDILVKS